MSKIKVIDSFYIDNGFYTKTLVRGLFMDHYTYQVNYGGSVHKISETYYIVSRAKWQAKLSGGLKRV